MKSPTSFFSRVWVFVVLLVITAGVVSFFKPLNLLAFFPLGMMVGACVVAHGFVNFLKKVAQHDAVQWGAILWPVASGSLVTILLYAVYSVE
jgi:hypothetical protein